MWQSHFVCSFSICIPRAVVAHARRMEWTHYYNITFSLECASLHLRILICYSRQRSFQQSAETNIKCVHLSCFNSTNQEQFKGLLNF